VLAGLFEKCSQDSGFRGYFDEFQSARKSKSPKVLGQSARKTLNFGGAPSARET